MPSEVSIAGANHDRGSSLEELKRELAEAREQQAATAEILRVISNSPTDLKRVFAEIAASAARLCDAYDATIHQVDGDIFQLVAHHGPIATATLPLVRGVAAGRSAIECRPVHVADLQAESDEYPEGSRRSRLIGVRTVLAVPLSRASGAIGVISVRRAEVRPFTDRQIELLKTFADQAVIAIENTRLFEEVQARTGELTQRTQELTEALEYQTATSKVLSIIGGSPGDLAPVFDAMLTNAVRICEAKFGVLFRYDGNVFQPAATLGVPPEYAEFLQERGSFRPTPGVPIHRLVQTEELIHITDDAAEQYPGPAGKYGGARSLIAVPMRKEKELIGAFVIYRTEVRPFTDKQIGLVKGFANQAVIAIENVRLLNELRESLQQQTATAEVLKVISRATFDLPRVLDTLVESAATLCDSYDTSILQKDGNVLREVAHRGSIPGVAMLPITRGTTVGRAVLDRETIHLANALSETDEYPESSTLAQHLGFHTILTVPLLGAGEAIGAISLRRSEVRPFTVRQIELLQTLADQAVIAIENARLFEEVQARTKELQESLEYQTATSEVLSVISRSPAQLLPVLDAIAKTSGHLCRADNSVVYLLKEGKYHPVAFNKNEPEFIKYVSENPIAPGQKGSVTGTAVAEHRTVHVPDTLVDVSGDYGSGIFTISKNRTVLSVPLLRDGFAIGAITVARRLVEPFDDRQIQLVTTFADQAVVAIANTRLFEDVQARTRELAKTVEDLEIASQHKNQFVARVSERMCKEVSVSLPLTGDSHDDDIDDYPRIA